MLAADRVWDERNEFGKKYGYPNYDCGTRALAIAANISYWGAFQKLRGCHTIGRRITNGPINGYWFKRFEPYIKRPWQFAERYSIGRYILYCYHSDDGRKHHEMGHHYVACVDGELSDNSNYTIKYAFAC